MTLAGLFREGVSILSQSGIPNAENEAVWIMDFALGTSRLTLRLEGERRVTAEDRNRVMELVQRRAGHEPLQFILGTQEFCGLEFEVGPAALIPRPETELLVEEVRRHCVGRPHPIIADIGSGSGCIAVALANAIPAASLYATDLSPAALDLARSNAARHGVQDRVVFLRGDLVEPLRGRGLEGRVAAVVSNPPYVLEGEIADLPPEVGSFEPRLALAGGADGLAMHRRLLDQAAEFLMPGGLLALEVGLGQAERLRGMPSAAGGYGRVRTIPDTAGIERVVVLEKVKR